MKAQVFDITGKKTSDLELSEVIFGTIVNPNLIAQAVRMLIQKEEAM
jgi:ribosomal protein L4